MRIPLISAILLVVFSVLIDLYILWDIKKSDGKRHKFFSIAYFVSAILCWCFIIVTLCLPKRNENASILPIMWMLFSFLTVYIFKFIFCIFSLIQKIISGILHKKIKFISWIGTGVGVFVFIAMWWGVIYTRNQIELNKVDIYSSKLPASFDGLKIAHFSDLHLGTWGKDTVFISKLVDNINSQNPDLILFTGDFMNRKSDEMIPFINILSRLKAPYGFYAVYGNHDYGGYVEWSNQDAYYKNLSDRQRFIDDMGIKMLNNQSTFLKKDNDSIVLIGVDNWGEPPFNKLGDLGKSYPESKEKLKGLNDDMYKILMTHNPEHWTDVVTKISNIDLTLSGHTHAMQTIFKLGNNQWSPAVFKYKKWGGLYNTEAKDGNTMNLYVNIGAGEVGFPSRIGAAVPEITMITLHKK